MTTPVEHIEEGQLLTADALVSLYEIWTKNNPTSIIRFRNGPQVSWQGNTYEALACNFSGSSNTATGEESRPSLTVINPEGVFKPFVATDILEYATVRRYRLLRTHLESNLDIKETRLWFINKIASITNQTITFELRNVSEGPNVKLPTRMYMPPDFPTVTI